LRRVRLRDQRLPGLQRLTTTCQLHAFENGQRSGRSFRATAFPLVQDLMDRGAFEKIMQAGDVSAHGSARRQTRSRPKETAYKAMDAATCIGCGACVAACPNASASLFTSAKVSHLNRSRRVSPTREKARAHTGARTTMPASSCTNHLSARRRARRASA
jgi:succinate dehydrogenase / fumarate reductase iron-sulfur subunit